MPKETFLKLNPEKRKKITDSFLREFSTNNYDDASLTTVVKSLGIAKGSIYQYFDSKLDLFLYLQSECGAIKAKYIMHLKRDDYPDFWAYFKALYREGIKFDLNHPLESNFLHSLAKHIHAPSLKELTKKWFDQVIGVMCSWIQHEVDIGHFRDDLPVKSMAFFLYTVSISIGDYMRTMHGLNLDENIKSGKPVYAAQKGQILLQSVDEYIAMLRKAFEK
ncbi:TetR/AcrR family transcriptional regulator [Fulvivirgaceae bacterium BMA12]|uniref:TetR/AcrR family transcriptional regulator n=1 Tax=Agaribacillus aureus TaxID=3051825 RepID=A0ABT8L8E5_9BACT|nr:TetR/AcrR family transcriptional regulator [Fulvivirgaceae bacterium BMA12]